jgi:hypothetical protein
LLFCRGTQKFFWKATWSATRRANQEGEGACLLACLLACIPVKAVKVIKGISPLGRECKVFCYGLRGFFLENLIFEKKPIKSRVNHGGNYCGHDKYNPCLLLASESGNRPPFLYSVGAAFRRYFFKPEMFPSLNHAAGNRQQRSERREAVVITMQSVLEFLDLSSLRVGIPTKDGFQPLKLEILWRRTGLHRRRFDRAIESLYKSGILLTSKQHKIRNIYNQYIYFPSVRRVSKDFFIAMGFTMDQLLEESRKSYERIKREAQRLGLTATNMVKISLGSAGKKYQEMKAKRQETKTKGNDLLLRKKLLSKQAELLLRQHTLKPDAAQGHVARIDAQKAANSPPTKK